MNIKTEERTYLGYRQGWKVFVNGKKFPVQRGHWYTCMDEKLAIKAAIEEAQYEAIVCRKDHSKGA